MKIKDKKIESLAKMIAKNYLVFCTRIFKDHDFSRELRALLNRYYDPAKTKSVIPSVLSFKIWNANNRELMIKSASPKFARKGLSIINTFDENKKSKFLHSISNFITEFNLGKEWRNTLITLITTGEFYPPNKNFYVGASIADEKRVVITLNPDTSLEDLVAEWNVIKKLQKFLWPDFKKTNLTNKSMTIFKNVFNIEMGRIVEAEKKTVVR